MRARISSLIAALSLTIAGTASAAEIDDILGWAARVLL